MWAMLIAGLILPATPSRAAPTPAQTPPFDFECSEASVNQVVTSMGPKRFDQREKTVTQRYRINPQERSVTRQFGYRSENEPWVEEPKTFKNVLFTPGGRVVFCERLDGSACGIAHRTTENTVSGASKTITFVTGQTVLHLGRNTMSGWGNMDVQASDRSYYTDIGMTEGRCRRL